MEFVQPRTGYIDNILNDGNWHNIVCFFNGPSLLYVDGAINSSSAAPALAGEPIPIYSQAESGFYRHWHQPGLYNLAVVVSDPTISLNRVGNSFITTYTGTLLSSTNVQGPNVRVAGAMSPYAVSTDV